MLNLLCHILPVVCPVIRLLQHSPGYIRVVWLLRNIKPDCDRTVTKETHFSSLQTHSVSHYLRLVCNHRVVLKCRLRLSSFFTTTVQCPISADTTPIHLSTSSCLDITGVFSPKARDTW